MNKVTIEGTEYNVVSPHGNACRVYINDSSAIDCAFTNRSSIRCADMPCRNPNVIFLTDANFAKLVTSRLTE